MKAHQKPFFGLTSIILVLAIFFAGCAGNSTRQENEATSDSIQKEFTLSPEAQNLLYTLPTPLEVTELLQSAGAGFIFDITNPISSVGKYVTEKSKALNLGIYSADLAYSATYNRTDETNKFLGCTSQLANELGIAGVYESNLVENVKKFGDNKDSLVALVSDIFYTTNDFLSKNNRNEVAVYVAAGAFTEGLYLASSLNMVANDNTKISTVLANQQENYTKLMSVLDIYQGEESMKSIYDAMIRIKPIFTDYGLVANTKLPKQHVDTIHDIIEGVRNNFIE